MRLDSSFICYALGLEIRGIAIQDVDIPRVHIDVGEEVGVHEGMVGFGVFAGDSNIFVLHSSVGGCEAHVRLRAYHIKGNNILE